MSELIVPTIIKGNIPLDSHSIVAAGGANPNPWVLPKVIKAKTVALASGACSANRGIENERRHALRLITEQIRRDQKLRSNCTGRP